MGDLNESDAMKMFNDLLAKTELDTSSLSKKDIKILTIGYELGIEVYDALLKQPHLMSNG